MELLIMVMQVHFGKNGDSFKLKSTNFKIHRNIQESKVNWVWLLSRACVCVHCAMCLVELRAHLLQDSSKVQFRIIIKWNPMRFSVLNVQFIEVEKSNNTTLYVCSAHLLYSNIKRIHSQKHIQTPILFMHFDIFRIQMGSYVRCH